MGVQALNCGHVREQAFPGMAYDIQQQPWDGIGVWRIDVRGGFAGDFAAVVQLPRRPGEMLADPVVVVAQFGLGSLERPTESAIGAGLAGVDLRSDAARGENQLQTCRNGERGRCTRSISRP